MNNVKIYLYGMIVISSSFYIGDEFLKPDQYSEIKRKYRFPGGETGTCATVLSSLGAEVVMDGNHIGSEAEKLVRDFYADKSVDLTTLRFDESIDVLEDYIIISGDVRTPMGTFGQYYADAYNSTVRPWNKPAQEYIAECDAAAIDPFFWEDSDIAAEYCVKHGKPYVTIDCAYDSYIHKNAAISVISGEGIANNYKGKTHEELFPLFAENSGGLTIITNGGDEFLYGRMGGEIKRFMPYNVKAVSTLGAGDSFKAGCTYALAQGMSDDETVSFASACAAIAISRYPLQLDPPRISEIEKLIRSR